MDIYNLLLTKSPNVHYINRYYKFIEKCKMNKPSGVYLEKHHILPKAKNFFPEFKSFSKNPWNMILLTPRQHFIAHWMLWKAYGKEMTEGFHCMALMENKSQKRNYKINSRIFEQLRIDYRKRLSELNKQRVEKGTHNFLNQSEKSKKKQAESRKGNQNAKGFKHTEQTKKKQSESRKGNQNAKGFKHTDEWKEKNSQRHKGLVACFDLQTNKYVKISSKEYNENKQIRYKTMASDMVNCYEIETGKNVLVPSDLYYEYRGIKYRTKSNGNVCCFDTVLNQKVKVSVEEYKQNKDRYITFSSTLYKQNHMNK